MTDSDPNPNPIQKLREDGLLWLINTAILHPRGYALAVQYADDDEECKDAIGLTVVGDGREPWVFGDDQWREPAEAYVKTEAERELLWSTKLGD